MLRTLPIASFRKNVILIRHGSWLSRMGLGSKSAEIRPEDQPNQKPSLADLGRPFGSRKMDQMLKRPEDRIRPTEQKNRLTKKVKDEPIDLPAYVPPMPSETHLTFHTTMVKEIDALGDRWKYPQEWEDYMEYAIENDVGLSPENPHIIYAEAGTAITSCICDPEMPFVNYHFVHENNGEPMVCQCGYFFKLERELYAPPLHKLMEIPDGGWFDPRAYNPDNNTYREWSWLKEQRITRYNALKSGEDYIPGSGLGLIEEAEAKKKAYEEIEDSPNQSQYVLDYRQKPDGYLNYTSTELRHKPGEEYEFESILVPEDDEEELLALQAEMSETLAEKYQARLSAQKQEFLEDPTTKKILSDYAEKKRQLEDSQSTENIETRNDHSSSTDDDIIKRQ